MKSPGWQENQNPQPGDFLWRSDDGLLVTVAQSNGETRALVSRRESPPSLADLVRVRRDFLRGPAVLEIPEVLASGGSREHAVVLFGRGVRLSLAEGIGVVPPGQPMQPQVTGSAAPQVEENQARDAWRGLKLGVSRLLAMIDRKQALGAMTTETEDILAADALAMEAIWRASKVFASAGSLVGAITAQVVLDLLQAVQAKMTLEQAARFVLAHIVEMEPDLGQSLTVDAVWEWWKNLVTLPTAGE